MSHLLEALQQSVASDFGVVLRVVNLVLMMFSQNRSHHYPTCKHGFETLPDEVLRARKVLTAFPRVAHPTLQNFYAADLPDILVIVNRPLVSLTILSKTCNNIIASTMILPMFEAVHRTVSRLRLLVLREEIDPDWVQTSALCRQGRIYIQIEGDLLSLMNCRGNLVSQTDQAT